MAVHKDLATLIESRLDEVHSSLKVWQQIGLLHVWHVMSICVMCNCSALAVKSGISLRTLCSKHLAGPVQMQDTVTMIAHQ